MNSKVHSNSHQRLLSSSELYQKTYKPKNAKCIVYVMGSLAITFLITQWIFLFTQIKGAVIAGAFMSISISVFVSMFVYGLFYQTHETEINVSKSSNKIEVTYRMYCFGRQMNRSEAIDNVQDIEVLPLKSQHGIVGYVANIIFKNGAKKIQIYKDRGDNDIVNDFEELSMFILGRNASGNQLRGNCDCSKGGCCCSQDGCCCSKDGCYCICCKNWGLVLALFIFISLLYIFVSFAIAYSQYSQEDGKLFD